MTAGGQQVLPALRGPVGEAVGLLRFARRTFVASSSAFK